MQLTINGRPHEVPDREAPPDMPLLWLLRDVLNLTGTKYGCGVGACGACTVLLDAKPVRSCITPLSELDGRAVTTIEGWSGAQPPHPLQSAWLRHQVVQCGYCSSGMLMAAAALLAVKPDPADADIDAAIDHLCRCGVYPRVRAAIRDAAAEMRAARHSR